MMQGRIRRLTRGLGSVRVCAGVLVLLSMLPSAALLVSHALDERAALLGAARLRAIETARLLAGNQEDLLRELDTELALLGPLALAGDMAGCNAAAFAAGRGGRVVLSVTDAVGRLVCSSLPDALGKDLSDVPSVRALLSPGGPARQQIFPLVGRLLGVPEMVNLVALQAPDGRRIGVAAAVVPFERLMSAARNTGRGAEDPVFLIDATTGEILARAANPGGWVGRRFPDHTVLRAFRATGREGVADGPNPRGEPKVFGYAPLRADGRVVLVVASVGRAALLARANQELLMSLLLAAALTLLGAAGAWWTAHLWLLQPLRRLAMLAGRLGESVEATGTRRTAPPLAPSMDMPRELRLLQAQLFRRGRSLLRARAALAGSEAEARLLADHCSDIILRMDREMRITFVSSAAQAVLGVTPARFAATSLDQAIHPEDLPMVRTSMARMHSTGHAPPLTYRRRGARGWVWLENAPHAVPGGQGYVCVLRDVTRRREAERQVRHMAHHDALTGLANRHKLHRGLEAMLAAAPMAGPVRVLCLDLDRFKEANDRLGHAVGDEVLREIARRLLDFPWHSDGTDGPGMVPLAARLGGDEFAVALQGRITPAGLDENLQKLVRRLSEPVPAEGHLVQIGVSIGVALHPEHGDTPTALLRVADAALYRAKHQGRGRVVLHARPEATLQDAG